MILFGFIEDSSRGQGFFQLFEDFLKRRQSALLP